MPEPLLKVENLKVSFKIKKQKTAAVEDVNFSLDEGKIYWHCRRIRLRQKA